MCLQIHLKIHLFPFLCIFFFIFPLMFAEEDLPIKSGVASHPPCFRLISCFWWHSCSFETLIDPLFHLKKYIRGKETSTESASLPVCHFIFFLQKVFQRAVSAWMLFLARRRLNNSEVRVQRWQRPFSFLHFIAVIEPCALLGSGQRAHFLDLVSSNR